MAKSKADKEKELKDKLQQEANAHVAQIKANADKAVKRKDRRIRRLKVAIVLLTLVAVGGLVAGGISIYSLKNDNKRLSDPQESAKFETEQLKKKVAALIDVPTDEEPTIANVSDASKAKEQSPEFFAKAQNGDRLLMYPKAKKAILYRPSTDRIIEVSTLNSGKPADKETVAPPDDVTTNADPITNPPAGTTTNP